MSAKISRTFLTLFCILAILLPSSGEGRSQAFSAISHDYAPDGEISEPDTENRPENGGGPLETDLGEQPETGDEPTETSSEPIENPGAEPPQQSDDEGLLREWNPEPGSGPDTENGGGYMASYESSISAYGLEPNERVVKTFAELKDALSLNNGITTVHLGGDITMQGGININSGKPHVTIDGLDPTDPNQTEPYTLTDLDSALFTDTVYLSSSAVSYIHVRDLKIVGKNYYGPFSVLDAGSMSKVKLIFERVDYNGPQFGYHRQGTIYVIDCKVRLHGGNGICASQEFSEAKELIFEGATTIDTATTAYSIFWHPLGGTFTVADDSSVTLSSPNTSSTFGMFYADGSAYKLDVTIGRRSVFDAAVLNSVASVDGVTLSSLTVGEGGSFLLTTTGAANRAVLSMGGNIAVEPDAEFIMNSFGGNYPALNLRTGDITVENNAVFHIISPNTNSSLLNLYGRSFICNDPASVLLYNPGSRNILATTSSGRIYIDAEQVNYWNTASKGGFDNPPLYRWKKTDGENIRIEAVLQTGAGGNLSSISSNYSANDLPGEAPSSATFNMESARVLAFGRLELMVNAPTTASSEITGVTAPGAAVRASFYQQGADYTMPDALAGQDGVFVIPIDVSLQILTDITVVSSYRYLTSEYKTSVGDSGALAFTVPGELRFYTSALSPKTQIVNHLHTNWRLMVSDTRGAGNTWSIYVQELQPLTPSDSSKPPLKDSLVFVEDTGAVIPLNTSGTLLIYRHTTVSDNEMVNISWPPGRGILARIPTGAAYSNQAYAGVIEWSLIDGP